ncbi:PKD domain-containing protein [Pedobacter lithocola]|uniref:PKD domain-containing protein n=1 Tax=Pedobacter lithocola TaxID=1908239 RepID=A0ABV8P890_9SPHI
MKTAFLVFIVFLFSFSVKSFGQNVSNEGTDFWAVFPTHVPSGNSLANIAVFVTSKFNTEVTVSCNGWTETQVIKANTATQFNVPRVNAYIDLAESNSNLTNRGIHIKVKDGQPKVSAYTHIYGNARSAASLILPYETLGQTYYSMNYFQTNGGNNYLAIVAAEDNTTVLIHEKNGVSKPITLLKAGDVYEYISGSDDLTGVFVESDPVTSPCKRFAAFSGTSVIAISCTASQDPLYQQLYPTVSWGKEYGVVPFINRKYILRILAQEDNTKVTYNGQTYTVDKGKFIESSQLIEPTFVSADKLISVAQYSLTQNCSSASGGSIIGDPDMVILNPIEFNIRGVTVFSSPLQNINVRYLNILINANKTGTFKINGKAPVTTWTPLLGNTTFSFAQIPVTDNSLTLTADDGFNAIAYGFGQAESYAYSAGTNLASNNYLTVVDEAKKEESPNGCVGQEIDFKVNLPYQPDSITWTLDSETEVTTTNLIPEVKNVNGQTIYIYRYPAKKTYSVAANHQLNVVAHVPNNAANCQNGDLETNYIFTIYDLPTAKFTVDSTFCAKTDVIFTDKSLSNSTDFNITNWAWDFGDGKKSDEQNPKHQYEKEGTYIVNLSVRSGTGCYSDFATDTVKIFPLPVSKFIASKNTCINTDYLVTDSSTVSSALGPNKIVKWSWDFGDGTKLDKLDSIPFPHQYKSIGTFKVSLTTTSQEGCVGNTIIQDVVVTGLPISDFTTPDICFKDGVAIFKNTSKNVDGTIGYLKFEWDFGDSSPATNSSNEIDGKHTYSIAGDYTVTLKTTNENGCQVIQQKLFTVNGQVEKADFSIQNELNLCSNNAVIITNLSKAATGKITRIEIFKDRDTIPLTIPYPDTTSNILIKFDTFGGLNDEPHTIKLIAYSGESCFEEATKTIILKPSPILEFADIPSVCTDNGSVIINQAKEKFGIVGTYSGKGIDADGNFNPRVAGVGQHEITYTVNAANGCADSIKNVINVYKSPTADMGTTLYILAGGQVKIPAFAEGSNLTYSWSPALGLDNASILNPIASPEKDTDYTLTATTSDGCTVKVIYKIIVLQALVPPNSFTPNGDGVNDVWNIKYLESYPNATVEVFNRNGNRVFFSNAYKVPFDGNYQNEPLPVGVYYYLINPRNGRKSITGPLTIIR